jgi:hypothetical protein
MGLLSAGNLVPLFGVLLGVLIFVGMFSLHAAIMLPPPCTQPFCSPPSDPAVVAYRDRIRTLGWVSMVALDLAVSFSVAMAWIVGGPKGNVPEGTKRGIFIFATVFLAGWLLFSWGAYSFLRFLVSFG